MPPGVRPCAIRGHRRFRAYGRGVPISRESLILAWLEVVEASTNTRESMCTVEASILDGVEALRADRDVLDSLSATRVKEQREDLDETWNVFAGTRRRFRVLLVAHCLVSGIDPMEALRTWGFTRGDVDELIQDARDLASSQN